MKKRGIAPWLAAKVFVSGFLFSTIAWAAKPYEGKTVRILSFQDNHARAVAANVKEFEGLSGARVIFDAVASNTVAAKTGTDQAAGGTYDLYAVDEPFMPQLAPMFIPLSEWPKPKVINAQEVELTQFLPAAVAGGAYRGVNLGLPVNGNVYMYVYRNDLFQDAGEKKAFKEKYGRELAPPSSTKDMKEIAEFFTRPPRLYGFAPFTKVSEGTTVEAVWVLSTFGVSIFDENLQLTFDEKKAAEAYAFYQSMMAFAPPGASNWHHAERMAAYSKGRVAQIMTWPSYVKDLEDAGRSLVVGKNAYAKPPAGPGGKPSAVAGTWTVAIPKTSQHKEVAAEFAYWWASKSHGARFISQGMNPARRDLLSDAELVRKNPWFPGILQNFESAVVRPRFPEYKQVSDVISIQFSKMISGQASPEDAAKATRAELVQLVNKLKFAKK